MMSCERVYVCVGVASQADLRAHDFSEKEIAGASSGWRGEGKGLSCVWFVSVAL
jgi:hypothetical protein